MATEQSALELKQQGAIEAAGNPDSSVTSEDAQKKMVEESRNAGVTAYSFDPDASPEEKRRQIRANRPDDLNLHRKHQAVAVATDADDGGVKADYLPAASKATVVDVDSEEGGHSAENQEDKEALAAKVGWTSQFGWPHESVLEGESLLDHQTWVEGKIPDKFYGDWYHNAGVIIFACLASWLVAVLGGGLAWVFIVMAICSTYYRTSLRRVRRNFRDDITREMGLKRLDSDTESLEWINAFMLKFWPIYQPVLAETIINAVDQVLSSATPSFLDSLKLKTFTLGSKPPRMEHVKTYPKEEDDTVLMDWRFSFTPNDTADMTARQVKNKVNPKVVLEIRVGKAMISKGLDVIVEDMSFSGIMRLKMKLQIPFPHIEKVEMCFTERPVIDYVCKPLGGDTFGFDINFIPGLEGFILEQIHGNLAPMMYHPNVFPIEVAKMLAGTPVDQAIGVVAVTLHGAQGLKNPDNFSGNPDPYVSLTLNRRSEIARTKTIKDTPNPKWNEVHYVIITSFNDSLDLMVYDYNEIRKDKELGVASFKLEHIEELPVHENQRLEVIGNGKARGIVSADIRFFPVLEPKKLEDGSLEPPPESNTGILRYTVEQAKDLDGTKSLVGLLNPYAELLLNRKVIHTTKKLKRTNNPIWDNGSKEMLITDRKKAELGLAIKDDRELAGDQLIGAHNIKLDDLLEMSAQGKDWFLLSGAKSGRVKVTAQWKPVALSGVLAGSGGYQTPIGVMRLHFKKARELRNFETMGKSDPYVRVVVSGIEKGRTVVHRNTLSPEWDEIIYVPIHSPRDRLTLDVMDAEKMGKDRSLGLIELSASDYVVQDESGEYMVHDKKTLHEDGLRIHGKGVPKGVLCYTTAFYPCLNVADPEEEEEEEEEAAAAPVVKQSLDIPRSAEAGKITPLERTTTNTSQLEPTTPVTPTMPKSPTTPSTAGRKSRDQPLQVPKVHLNPEELLKHESGFLIFKLMEGQMPKHGTHLEVYVDDMVHPSYVSGTAKSKSFKFDEIGDCFIRELEFSRLTLKVREKREKPGEERDEDHTIARLAGNTLDTLKQCLNNPTILKLKDEENRETFIKVSLKYIPVKMHLDPSESINNMGNLRVDVLDATDLPAADSNGKSDPYAKFEFNGQDVFKTKTVKKTLNPTWNEYFEMPVPSRTAAKFNVKVYDYDFADKPDFLGGASINLEHLDPFKAKEVKLLLDGKSGSIRLRLLFRPDYVTRSRLGTGTFSGTFGGPGRIVTGVAGAPIKGGAAVAGVVGHGVGKGASFIKRGFTGRKKDDENGSALTPTSSDIPTIVENGGGSPALGPGIGLRRTSGLGFDGGAPPPRTPPSSSEGPGHHRVVSAGGMSVASLAPGGAGAGTATFQIISASGFPPSADVFVLIRQLTPRERTVGKTKHHESPSGQIEFNETFKHACTADTQFRVEVKGHHTFGSDDDFGDALFFVSDQGSAEKEISVGSGTVVIKSSFAEAASSLTADSPKSTSGMRRSFLSKKESRPSREGTPS